MRSSFSHTPLQKSDAQSSHAGEYVTHIAKVIKNRDYAASESSLAISADTAYQNHIRSTLRRFSGVHHVVLVGIGGSSLGTEAVYSALKTDKSPSLLVMDTLDEENISAFRARLATVSKVKDIAVVIISKSGTTTETVTNATCVLQLFEKKFGEKSRAQVVFVGDEGSALVTMGHEKNVCTLTLPSSIGGRYSVFTAAGMVPLTLLKIDTESFLRGARNACTKKSFATIEKRASVLARMAAQGVHTVNFFTFNKRLRTVGLWYRQLLAESIGRHTTVDGKKFINHLNPTVTTDADLHSVAELYLGGYRGVYTRFVLAPELGATSVPKNHWLVKHVPHLGGKRVPEIRGAIRTGVLKAYDEQSLPYEKIELASVDAEEVGTLLTSLMCEMMVLAHLLNINPFIQPSVESYKSHTRSALTK